MNPLAYLKREYGMAAGDIPVWIVGLAIAALWVMPFVWMISTSLKYPGDVMTVDIEWLPNRVTFQNYVDIFTKYPVWRWTLNSIIVSVSATFLCVMSGALAGYALARMNFPGRHMLFFLYVASLMVPIEVYAVPMLLGIIKVGWANTYQALILPSVGNVFSVLIFRQFFLTFPRDLEDAARIDGAGHGVDFLEDRVAPGPGTADRRDNHHLRAQLEQLPVAIAGGLQGGHEDPARRHCGFHADIRHGNPA